MEQNASRYFLILFISLAISFFISMMSLHINNIGQVNLSGAINIGLIFGLFGTILASPFAYFIFKKIKGKTHQNTCFSIFIFAGLLVSSNFNYVMSQMNFLIYLSIPLFFVLDKLIPTVKNIHNTSHS